MYYCVLFIAWLISFPESIDWEDYCTLFLGFYLNSYGDHINQNYLNLDEYLNA